MCLALRVLRCIVTFSVRFLIVTLVTRFNLYVVFFFFSLLLQLQLLLLFLFHFYIIQQYIELLACYTHLFIKFFFVSFSSLFDFSYGTQERDFLVNKQTSIFGVNMLSVRICVYKCVFFFALTVDIRLPKRQHSRTPPTC